MRASNYRSIRGQLYTREKYVRGSPQIRIVKFEMGEDREDYNVELRLAAKEKILIRDNALEALRISANKTLARNIGDNYLLKFIIYPHHILREHKYMTGAGADRLSDGMKHAFGKPVGRAAAVQQGQSIISVKTYKRYIDKARRALKIASSKVPKGATIEIVPLDR